MRDLVILCVLFLVVAGSAPAGDGWDAREYSRMVTTHTEVNQLTVEYAHKALDFLRYEWLTANEVADSLEKNGDDVEPLYEQLYDLQFHGMELYFEGTDYDAYNYGFHVEYTKLYVPREI